LLCAIYSVPGVTAGQSIRSRKDIFRAEAGCPLVSPSPVTGSALTLKNQGQKPIAGYTLACFRMDRTNPTVDLVFQDDEYPIEPGDSIFEGGFDDTPPNVCRWRKRLIGIYEVKFRDGTSWQTAAGIVETRKWDGSVSYKSPDKRIVAVVHEARNPTLRVATESTVSILGGDGASLASHDCSSQEGDQGYIVDGVRWTPDSQFCIFRLRSSGGHSPMFAPIVIWNRKTKRLYSLVNYTADTVFSVAAPDKLKASAWPTMKPATLSLHVLIDSELSELR